MTSAKTVSFYILAALLIAALSAGIALAVSRNGSGSPGVEILLPTATPIPELPELKVYVSGAVARPGVYSMAQSDRLADALEAAGGAVHGARLDCVNQSLRVKDEAHYHVPGAEEQCQPSSSAASLQGDSGIDLNTASAEEMESLPGIGEVKARAIVDYREKNGRFGSTDEVVNVDGIGPTTYKRIKDLVYVSGGAP